MCVEYFEGLKLIAAVQVTEPWVLGCIKYTKFLELMLTYFPNVSEHGLSEGLNLIYSFLGDMQNFRKSIVSTSIKCPILPYFGDKSNTCHKR